MSSAMLPSDIKFGSAPVGRLDAVLAAAHMIPRQKDVPGLLRMVKYCSQTLLAFQRVCVMIETPLRERSRLYVLDVTTNTDACSRVEMMADEGKFAFFRQSDFCLLTGKELQGQFPAAARLEVFNDLRRCLLLPLPVGVNGYHAALLFIWTKDGPGSDFMPLCHVLGSIVAAALTQVLQSEEQNMALEALRQERDRLNILVGIANVVNSTLNLENLLDAVSMDLRRFFKIKDVALLLHENDGKVAIHVARFGKGGAGIPRGLSVPQDQTLLAHFHEHEAFRLLRENVLQDARKTDPLAAYLLANGDKAVCGFPLLFQQHYLGALLLAHSSSDVFTREMTSLVSQIAISVALAVHNAQEYTNIDMSRRRLVEENATLSAEIAQHRGDGAIIGKSEAIRKVLRQIDMVAGSDSNVLLLGETGTGKELVAEAIHKRSSRKACRMVKINCAAVPAGLLESELFGYEKGAFTGASRQSKGRFELAQGSTLMLDEVGDLPLELQPKLLRILQSRELERLGGHTVIPVDVRLVAATNQNLLEMVRAGRFREDLYYRLNVFPIHLPSLRERREDIPLLAQHFMEQIAKRMHKEVLSIPTDVMHWLCQQPWPGNVRELSNVIERAVICSTGTTLYLEPEGWLGEQTPVTPAHHRPSFSRSSPTRLTSDEARQEIIDAVRACNGLIAGPRGAAALLGVNRTTLNSRMKRLGLDVKGILEKFAN